MEEEFNEAKNILDIWIKDQKLSTYKELADYLKSSPNTLDTWKARGKIPEKHILKYTQMNPDWYKKNNIGSSTGSIGHGSNVNQHGIQLNGVSSLSALENMVLDLFRKASDDQQQEILYHIMTVVRNG